MALTTADESHAKKFAALIPDMIHMTGPSSYDFQFGADRTLFDVFIETAWLEPHTIFSHTEATLEVEDDQLIGMEIGFGGQGWYGMKKTLRDVSMNLLDSGKTTLDALRIMGTRSREASYMNPYIPNTAYYVLALAVSNRHRGTGMGAKLLNNAIDTARNDGFREVHLDVLSDNPAVKFYQAMGFACMAETVGSAACRDYGIPMEMRMVLPL